MDQMSCAGPTEAPESDENAPKFDHNGSALSGTFRGFVEGAKIASQNAQIDLATKEIEALKALHSKSALGAVRGHVAEIFHKTTFNLDAIQKGSDLRAELVPGAKAADIIITGKGGVVVDQAQLKSSESHAYLKTALKRQDYNGMQKVVSAGMEVPARGWTSSVASGDVASKPLSVQEGNLLTQNPEASLNSLRPSTLATVRSVAAEQAFMGGVIGAGMALGASVWQKGGVRKLDSQDAAKVVEAGAVSGVASSVSAAATVALNSIAAGSVAAGTVITAYQAYKCKDPVAKRREAVQGAAGTLAAAGVGAFSPFLIAVTGPLALVVCPLAIICSNIGARTAAGWVFDQGRG